VGICLLEGRLHDFKTDLEIKWWPSLQDYNEAIQIPRACLQDEELRNGLPYTTALGLPRPITGAFASVYKMHCAERDYALRLFLKNIDDQAKRYDLISDFVQHDSLPYTVTFDFLLKGIKSRSDWFPALKMEWVEGTPFEEYVIENLREPAVLGDLGRSFVQMMNEMRLAGIAHGDLQHGNIIMCGKELRLVDYDGMFVPAMKNFTSSELGHPNYQHPSRTALHFGPYLDNFSAWIVYASIRALELDPGLFHQLAGGDDCLLFRRSDFLNPLQSPAFAAFEKHENDELQKLGLFVRAQLSSVPEKIPYLQLPLPDLHVQLDAIPDTVSSIKSGPRLVRGDTSDASAWLHKDNLGALNKSGLSKPELSKSGIGHKETARPQAWFVQAQAAKQSVWVKPTANPTSNSSDLLSSVPGLFPPMPPELTTSTPRPVALHSSQGRVSPVTWQWLMLLCPCVWWMLCQFYIACTLDENLRVNGRTYDATVTNVFRSTSTSKGTTYYQTDVDARFFANGKAYSISQDMGKDDGVIKKGDTYHVHALPSDPQVQEPLGAKAGTKQAKDFILVFINLIVNLALEFVIWFKPWIHKHLAKFGIPVVAKIVGRSCFKGSKATTYAVSVTYTIQSKTYKKSIIVDGDQYDHLQQDRTEIMLCDPEDFHSPVFYRYCYYNAVLPAGKPP
jgi:hypothetical protein